MDVDILELDRLFREVNFGIPINHETFDQHLPRGMDKVKDLTEYRKWKQRQIIFKRQQLLERQIKFQKRLDHFKDKRDERKEFDKLCKFGYEKDKKEQDYLSYLASQGSGLLFLDGSNKNSGSLIIKDSAKTLRLGPDVEQKVRQLLGRTELKGIAETAKVLVEIADNTFQSTNNMHQRSNLNNVSSMMTGQIQLSPRQSKTKLPSEALVPRIKSPPKKKEFQPDEPWNAGPYSPSRKYSNSMISSKEIDK